MPCPKFNKLVCLNSTRFGKYGSAYYKTIIVSLPIYKVFVWSSSLMIPLRAETWSSYVLTFCEINIIFFNMFIIIIYYYFLLYIL